MWFQSRKAPYLFKERKPLRQLQKSIVNWREYQLILVIPALFAAEYFRVFQRVIA